MFTAKSLPALAESHPAGHCGKWSPAVHWERSENAELPRWPPPGRGFRRRRPAPSPRRPETSG